MKPLPREVVEQALRGEVGPEFLEACKRLPQDVDPSLAADAVVRLLGSDGKDQWLFARHCQALPAPVIEAVLQRFERDGGDQAVRLFLREAVRLRDGLSLQGAWTSALLALLDLGSTYAWGSKQKKAKFKTLANTPRMLAAAQAAVVGSKAPMPSMLAVLATHGGEEAADALLTVFSRGGLDVRLEELSTHAAATPAMAALLSSVTERLEASAAGGPFAAFARRAWGFDPGRARIDVLFSSVAAEGPDAQEPPRFQGSVSFRSDRAAWWSVSLTDLSVPWSRQDRSLSFGPVDTRLGGVGLARCAVEELPAWLRSAAGKLETGGWREPLLMGSLRGKKRGVVLGWLFGA